MSTQRRKITNRPRGRVDSAHPRRHTLRVAARDPKRLAKAVVAARNDLKLSQEEFAARGSLGIKTLQRIERERIATPRGATLTGLDEAADWPRGTARAIFESGAEAPTLAPASARQDDPEDEAVAALRRMVELIPSIRRRFGNEQAEAMIGRIMTLAQQAGLTELVADELNRQSA